MLSSVNYKVSEVVTANPISELQDMFQAKLLLVDAFLDKSAYSTVKELPLISKHIIRSGGKRIRPLLTLASASLCGYEGDDDISIAACVELLHTATLLHDDVIDESPLRRNAKTAHVVWGNQRSILTGDFLFSKLFQVLVEYGNLEILNLFSGVSQTIIEGEMLQINERNNPNITEEEYLKIAEAKTSVLFGLALELGAKLANASHAQLNALTLYARAIGTAFQIIDDLLDYMADEPVLGKSVGNDLLEGQVTLPLIYLLQSLPSASNEKLSLIKMLESGKQSADDFAWVKQLMIKFKIKDQILKTAHVYAKQAEEALVIFPESSLKELFLRLPAYIINRCN